MKYLCAGSFVFVCAWLGAIDPVIGAQRLQSRRPRQVANQAEVTYDELVASLAGIERDQTKFTMFFHRLIESERGPFLELNLYLEHKRQALVDAYAEFLARPEAPTLRKAKLGGQ